MPLEVPTAVGSVFRPNSRAIFRVADFPGWARMKATEGVPLWKKQFVSRCFAINSAWGNGRALVLGGVLGAGFARGGFWPVAVTARAACWPRAALLRFGFAGGFFLRPPIGRAC